MAFSADPHLSFGLTIKIACLRAYLQPQALLRVSLATCDIGTLLIHLDQAVTVVVKIVSSDSAPSHFVAGQFRGVDGVTRLWSIQVPEISIDLPSLLARLHATNANLVEVLVQGLYHSHLDLGVRKLRMIVHAPYDCVNCCYEMVEFLSFAV